MQQSEVKLLNLYIVELVQKFFIKNNLLGNPNVFMKSSKGDPKATLFPLEITHL